MGISSAIYDDKSLSLGTGVWLGVALSTDGTKLYVCDYAPDKIHQFTLSIPFDISTGTPDSVSLDVTTQDGSPRAIAFKPDGTKLYVLGDSGNDVIQYGLSVAWDIDSAVYDDVEKDISDTGWSLRSIVFSPDGSAFYVTEEDNRVHQWDMSPAWDIATATNPSKSLDISTETTLPRGLFFNDNGTKVYVIGGTVIYQYGLSVAWDISTGSYDDESFNINSQTTYPWQIHYTGEKFYIVEDDSNKVHQYSFIPSPVLTPSTLTPDDPEFPNPTVTGGVLQIQGVGITVDSPEFPISTLLASGLLTPDTLDLDGPEFPISLLTTPINLIVSSADIADSPEFPTVSLTDAVLSVDSADIADSPEFPTSALSDTYIAAGLDVDGPEFPKVRLTQQIDQRFTPVVTYQCILTGAADLVADLDLSDSMANFQNYLNNENPSFTAVTVRVTSDIVTEIQNRENGEILINRVVTTWQGDTIVSEIARVPFETLRTDQGASSFSAVLSGSTSTDFTGSSTIELTGVSLRRQTGLNITFRAEIDSNLKPSDVAVWDGESITVSTMKHIYGSLVSFMELTGVVA